MNNSVATLIVSDYNDLGKWMSWRPYEAIRAATIPFIDNDSDPEHKVIDIDYLYVHNKEELSSKVLELKNNKQLRKELITKCIDYLNNIDILSIRREILDYIETL